MIPWFNSKFTNHRLPNYLFYSNLLSWTLCSQLIENYHGFIMSLSITNFKQLTPTNWSKLW